MTQNADNSKPFPTDFECFSLDLRCKKSYDLSLIEELGYNSMHLAIRDLIIASYSMREIKNITGLHEDTIRNASGRMQMSIKRERSKKIKKNSNDIKKRKGNFKKVKYKLHKCNVDGCQKMTTNRLLCDSCYRDNSDIIEFIGDVDYRPSEEPIKEII